MTEELPDVEMYRLQARAWLAANLERRSGDGPRRTRGMTHRTAEDFRPERALQRKLFDAGYMGITVPTEFGGQGLTGAHERAFQDEASGYVQPDLGIAGAVTRVVCANTMLAHASDEFNRRHLPPILSGDALWVEFFSEPSAGSDMAGITTTAARDGDNWILNGSKIWSSGAYYADYGMCLARTDWDVPKHRGLTWFAVPTAAAGVTVEPLQEITGDIEFCKETFVDVVIPDVDRIGDVNDGWTVAQTALLYEREASSGGRTTATVAPQVGALAPDLVALARRVGRDHDAHIRQLIARAHTQDWALGQLGVRVGQLMRESGPAGAAIVSYIKLAAGTVEPERARAAMEIGGGGAIAWPRGDRLGVTTSLGYLNSRVTSIAGGSNEMQRNGVGERVLGLPREPSFDRDKPFREVVADAARWSGSAPLP
jgi:alkylation response protein AidB-like acyl-CoA dehydrogenase